MATQSAAQVYQQLLSVGFPPDAAVRMVAIAQAESSLNLTELGDVGLEDATWGPSFGLYQIRTLKADTGRGTDRDISWLSASPLHQAQAAYDISGHGTNFTPWTTFTSGKYTQFLGQARAAAAAAGSTVTPVSGDSGSGSGPFPTWGPWWLPWNIPSDVGNAASEQTSKLFGGIRTIVIEGVFVVLGLGLLGVGVARAVGVRRLSKLGPGGGG